MRKQYDLFIFSIEFIQHSYHEPIEPLLKKNDMNDNDTVLFLDSVDQKLD